MPAVASISIEYGKFSSFTQTPPNNGPFINPVNSRVFAQYALYNRDYPDQNFKIDDNTYLSYLGGFLTEDSKINFKNSDFEIRNTTASRGGNLYVSGTSKFFSNINVADIDGNPKNNIRNVRRIKDVNDLKVTAYDSDALSVGDFKKYLYHPGMIVYYKGTLDSIRSTLPFWRICAPPDSGQIYTTPEGQTVVVPNLFSKFIPCSQPVDTVPDGGSYKTENTGGFDAIQLTLDEMPIHNHSIVLTITGQEDPVLGGAQTFRAGNADDSSGKVNLSYSQARLCNYKGGSCKCTVGHVGRRRRCDVDFLGVEIWCGTTVTCSRGGPNYDYVAAVNVTSVTSLNINSYSYRLLKHQYFPARITRQGETLKGNDVSHENRPMFYTLIPIIYVGEARP